MNDSLSDAHLCPGQPTVKNRAFSLTWPASIQFIGTKGSVQAAARDGEGCQIAKKN